jgi:hypothetical protein
MRSELLVTKISNVYVENGMLYTTYTVPHIHLEDAKQDIALIKAAFADFLPLPLVIDNRQVKTTSKEVRDYFASDEASSMVNCSAIVLNSTLAKISINLFLQFSKPKYPVKMFTDVESAVKWASQFKK